MCIVCEIRNKLLSEVANKEVVSFIMERVEIMAACLQGNIDQGRSIVETKKINRTKYTEVLHLSSSLLSDSDEAVAERNAAMQHAREASHPLDQIVSMLEAAFGLRPSVKPEGLPQEVWDAMPDGLRELLDGATVLGVTPRNPTKH
uniref:Uncharacterized protein n=1 Tax=Pseudomonas phage Pavpe01 TaxID=3138545 RepID=A0AAU6VZR0_9VIRU